ncbi:hypothetical protein O181_003244 [Austropuccinia psidii MF-1]|uniref:Uncharacterized protein n=1 Tax=Austropuccinia psidii MF-1 TaxID=1389203 RepID=A0A9Q3BDS2_9BASI|nr:hypothetical protein [Austropuccinia psidii MF-1]
MEDIITRTRIDRTWTRNPMESIIFPKPSNKDRRPERPGLHSHKCGSTSHLAKTCSKKTKINAAQIIEEVQCAEEKEKSHQYDEISDYTPEKAYPMENITAFFEVIGLHTCLPQYS